MRTVLTFLALCQIILGQAPSAPIMTADLAGNSFKTDTVGHLTKVAPDGKTVLWEAETGGRIPASLAVDSQGNIYAGGSSGTHGFLAILDSGGKTVSITELERPVTAVALDAAGTVYLGGNGFVMKSGGWSVAAPSTPRALAVDQNGFVFAGGDGFVGKITPDGSRWAWTYWLTSDPAATQVRNLALAPDGGIYLAGETSSELLPLRNAHQVLKRGPTDAFVARLSADGQLLWSTYIGGEGEDSANVLALDARGNPVVGGTSHGKSGAKTGFVARFTLEGRLTGSVTQTAEPVTHLEPEEGRTASVALQPRVQTPTTVAVDGFFSSATYGTVTPIRGTVSTSGGQAFSATGWMSFYDGGAFLGRLPLTAGTGSVTLNTNSLAAGKHSLWVRYSGDASFGASVSGKATYTLNAATATTFSAGSSISQSNPYYVATFDYTRFFNQPVNYAAVVNRNTNQVFVYKLNAATAVWTQLGVWGTNSQPGSVAVADFNGDGYPDLAITNSLSNNISILTATYDNNYNLNGFSLASQVPTGVNPRHVAVADLNSDGIADLVVAQTGANTVGVYLGTGSGTFNAGPVYNSGSAPNFVAITDFNGDGKPDVAVANANEGNAGGQNTVAVYLGNGDGTLSSWNTLVVGNRARAIAVGDFNGDGKPDLATANFSTDSLSIFLQNSAGTGFTQIADVTFPSGTNPWSLVTTDLNGDGKADFVVSAWTTGLVYTFLGNGSGGFSAGSGSPFTVSDTPGSLALGDFDANGTVDVMVGSQSGSSVSTLLGTSPVAKTATSITLTVQSGASFTTSTYGSSVSFTGTTQPANISGSITYYDGARVLGSAAVGSSLSGIQSLEPGTHNLTARYNGDSTHLASVSSGYAFTVTAVQSAGFLALGTGLTDTGASFVTPAKFGGLPGYVAVYSGSNTVKAWSVSGATATLYGSATVGTNPTSAIVGDFNGDTFPDIAVTNSGDNTVTVLLGNGSGTFTAAASSPITVGSQPGYVTSGDFNNDGILDLAVTNYQSNNVSILLGNGNGTFRQATGSPMAVSSHPRSVTVAEATGDSNADLFVTNEGDSSTYILLGNGDGTFFTWSILAAGSGPRQTAVADFNNDGKSDAAIANYNDGTVSIYVNSSSGFFYSRFADVVLPSGAHPVSVMAFDLNADGKPDLAVTDAAVGKLYVYFGNGNGGFTFGSQYATGGNLTNFLFADLNGDGRPDMLLANSGGAAVALRGAVSATVTLSSSPNPSRFGQTVSLNVSANPLTATPTPFLVFDGAVPLAAGKTDQLGNLSLSTPFMGSGTRSLRTSLFNPSATYFPAFSKATQTVNASPVGGFQPATYGSGATPQNAAVGDFNGDGIPDYATSNQGVNSISVYLGTGTTFTQASGSPYADASGPQFVAVGDFNNDGNQDLAVVNFNGSLTILLGSGTGTFAAGPAGSSGVGSRPNSIALSDFNNDGIEDLAVTNANNAGTVTILLGDGAGKFTSTGTPVSVGAYPGSPLVADFNGDGNIDIYVSNAGGQSMSILLGNGAGGFTPSTISVPGGAYGAAIADFDGDGNQDIAIGGDTTIAVLRGNGAGAFTSFSGSPLTAGSQNFPLLASDFNGDGKADLAFLAQNNLTLVVLLNTSSGSGTASFSAAPYSPVATPNGPNSLQVADVNGDGSPDLIMANTASGNVSVFRGAVESSVTLSATPNPSAFGSAVTLTATVSPVTVSGYVTFYDGVTVLGSAFASAGSATFSSNQLAAGAHSLYVYFAGNATTLPSISSRISQTVNTTVSNGGLGAGSTTIAAGANSVATADLNGDGKSDLVAVDSSNNQVSVWLGNGSGVFSQATGSPYAAGTGPGIATIADFNRDGRPDIAVTNYGSNSINILLQNSNGTFAAPVPVAVGSQPTFIATSDFNSDGIPDLAVTNFASNNVQVLIGDGTGAFPAGLQHTYSTGSFPWSVTVADLDGDGFADLVTSNGGNSTATLLLGNGDGTFHASQTLAVGGSARSVTAGYFNAGTGLDLAIANYNDNTVSIYLQATPGSGFIAGTTISLPAGANPWTIRAGDFNADGKIDLAIGAFNGNSVYLYLGNGDGTFTAAAGSPFAAGNGPGSLVIGDFNGDGAPDLAIANQNSSAITFLVGTNFTTTSIAISPNPVSWSVQGARLTATVSPAAAPGRVTFYADTTVLGSSVLSNGTVTFVAATYPPGTKAFRARYQGGAGYLGSASALVAETVNVKAGGAFSNAGTISQAGTRNVTPGDLDGNGRPDFVSANSAAGTISVWYNAGAITAGPVVTVGTNPFASAIGDFNRDGKPDIAVVNFGSSNVSIVLQGANNTFSLSGNVTVATNPTHLASGDFNGDGLIDLAVANYGSGILSILLGNGDGTFRPSPGSPVSTVANPQFIAVSDLNGDGVADLVVTGAGNGNNVSILLGTGTGAFTAGMGGTLSAGWNAGSVAVADLNGDAKPDLAITGSYTDNVTILLQKSDRTGFNAGGTVAMPAGSNPLSVVAVDFDVDGQIDLAVGSYTASTVTTFKNNGAVFTQSGRYPVAAGPGFLAVVDVDTEGTPDLVVSGQNAGAITLLAGSPATTVSLTATPATVTSGTPVAITITLTVGASGNVTLYDGATILGTAYVAPLGNSIVTFTANNMTAGTHSIRAYYAGDAVHPAAASSAISVTVNALIDYTVSSSSITAAGGNLPQALVTADFNNDGRLDIAAIDAVNQTIRVSLAQLAGPMVEAAGSPISDTHGPVSLVAGDFNNDGKTDLAIANATDHSVTILLGNGTGGFTAAPGSPVVPNTPGTGSNQMRLAIADFNGDGLADIIVTTPNANTTTILLGNGLGGFSEWSHYNVTGQVAVADFNGDGIPDFAVTGSTPSVWLGDGGGSFRQLAGTSFGSADKVVAGLFDSDTRPDLAYVNSATGAVTVWLGNGQGGFTQHGSSFTPGVNITAAVTADFNGDGKADLAFGFGTTLQFWLSDGAGGFAQGTPAAITLAGAVLSAVAADVDRDGRADLVVGIAASGSGFVQVFRGLAAPTTLALTASPNPVALGNPVTLTATVSPPNATGRVAFYSGAIVAGFGTVSNGVATFAPPFLPAGTASVKAIYLGDSNFAVSTAPSVTLNVSTGSAATYVSSAYVVFGGATEMRRADLNNDGIEDFVFVNNNSIQVCVGGGIPHDSYGYPNGCDTLNAGSSPVSVAVADYNQDGYQDLAVANITEGTVVVLPGNGNGKFGSPSTVYAFGQNVWPNSIAAADFDEDGKPDLVVTNLNAAAVAVLKGDGQGGFTLRASLPTGTGPYSVLTTDLNKDLHADIAVYNYVSHSLSLYRGDGFGAFTQAPGSPLVLQSTSTGAVTALVSDDLNNDGYPDFVVPHTNDSNILIAMSNSSGAYTARTVSVGSIGGGPNDLNMHPTLVYTADVNGDGNPDLVLGGNSVSSTSWHVPCPYVAYFPNKTAQIIAAVSTFNLCDGHSDYAFPSGIIMTGDGSGNFTQFVNGDYISGQTTPLVFRLPAAPATGLAANPYPYNGRNSMATLFFGDASHIYSLMPQQTYAWTATLSHSGSFVRGQSGQYTISVRNSGSTGIHGPVTVSDIAPAGMTITAMSGLGWDCSNLPTCTRPDGINNGFTYQPITVTVSVSQTAATPLVNVVSVFGEIYSTTATDSTNILFGDTLTIQKSHSGSFYQGQIGAQYSLTVSNTSGVNSGGTITVTDTPPAGMTITSMSGSGWICAALPACSRTDVLAGGTSFPPITVTVNVAANAGSPLVNQATVSGGNAPSASTSDSTVVNIVQPVFVSLPATTPTGTVPAFAVQFRDSQGTVLTGLSSAVTISSTPTGMSGTLTANTVNGVATFNNVVLAAPGTYTLSAVTSVGTVTATVVVTVGPPAKLAFTAPPSYGFTGFALSSVAVQVQDAYGNPITNSSAPVTISSSPSGVTGTLTANASGGIATFTNLVFNSQGTYTLTASSGVLTSATSAALPVTTAHLVFSAQPAAGTAGTPLSTVSVQIADPGGNVLPVAVPVTVTSVPSGVVGTLTATSVNGVATFSNLAFATGGSYTLNASAGGVTGASSSSITIATPHLVFTTQPSAGTAGTALSTVSVQIADPGGNVVSGFAGTVSIASTPAGVGGTLTATSVNGVATFSSLVFTAAGSYTLNATAPGVTGASSSSIAISAGAAAKLAFATQPPSSVSTGSAFGATVQIQDAYSNPVLSTVQVSIGSPVTGTTSVTAVGGLASFTNLILPNPGTYVLNASSPGLSPASSSSVVATGPGVPAKLAFVTQPPSSVNTNQTFGAVVQIQDVASNLVSSTVQVTISSPVTGTTTVSAVGGVATFTNLILPSAGTYVLSASSPGLSSASSTSVLAVQASQAQTINFSTNSPLNVPFATPASPYSIPLFASATSGLQVSFLSSTPSVCTVPAMSTFSAVTGTWNVTASAIGYGTCSITATQAGGGVWQPATPVTQDMLINGPLAVKVSHSGTLQKGQNGARYSVVISNVASTDIAIVANVAFSTSAGLNITAISGFGWSCSVGTVSCTRSSVLGRSGAWETILVTVNIAGNAASPASLQVTATNTAIGVSASATDSSGLLPSGGLSVVFPTSTTLAVTPSAATLGAPVTMTASVATAGSGQVSFFDGAAILGVSAVDAGGVATLSTSLLRPGVHSLTARFNGALPNQPSISAPVVATVSSVALQGWVSGSIATQQPASVAQGDFNADGITDLAVANQAANTVSIYLGSGSGGFTPAASSIAVGQTPTSVLALDFNADGKLDLAVTNSASGSVSVLLGDGTGAFSAAPGSPLTSGNQPLFAATGDFNGDGQPDLAIANSADNTVSIFVGYGNGAFSNSSTQSTGLTPSSIAVADFDGDGYADFATANRGSGTVTVKLGNGRGVFVDASGGPFAAGSGARSLVTADFNGDNILDLAVANFGAGTVSILYGDGFGSFPNRNNVNVGANPAAISLSDFNADGITDLAVANSGSGTVSILLGNGSAFTFMTNSPFGAGTGPVSLVAGEFNGDGRPDLALAANGSNEIRLLLGQSPTVITWNQPAAIPYGTPLSATQLNATANTPGTFVYTPLPGSVLNAGLGQTLSVTFTPTDTAGHATATATVTINVTKATPAITWANPAAVTFGTVLSPTQLNATTSVPGTFTYTPAAGTILPAGAAQILSVTFTPTDTTNYGPATATTTITVNKATPAITWTAPTPITYGTALSATQLNATAGVPGTFAYTPAAGAVLSAGTGQTLSVTFTPTDTSNYGPATATTTITVNKATPAITWTTPAPITYGTALSATQLNATASVPGTFAYTPAAGTVLQAGAAQTLSVTFTPTDTANYGPATATTTITVNKATPVITWTAPAPITVGTVLSATQLNATANVPGAFAYTPPAGTTLPLGTGQILSVTFTPTDAANYGPATTTTTITVGNKTTPVITWANPAAITYGTALSATQLNATANVPGTFAYTPAAGATLPAGTGQTLSVTFTPTDAATYATATASAIITVNKATPVITWAAPAAITYGTALSATQLNATASVPGTFVYTPAGGTVLPAGTGQTLSVTFTPANSANYSAKTASTAINVAALPQVIEVTSQIKATSTGLVLNRATNTYTSTLTVTNNGTTPITLPLHVVLTGLPAGVSLTSQTGTVPNGTFSGAPYMTVTGTAPLAPGASVSLALRFTNPANVPISYITKALSGSF